MPTHNVFRSIFYLWWSASQSGIFKILKFEISFIVMIKIQQISKVHNLNSSTQCNTKSSRLLLFVVIVWWECVQIFFKWIFGPASSKSKCCGWDGSMRRLWAFIKAQRTLWIYQGWEKVADDIFSFADDLLERFLVCRWNLTHTRTQCSDALYRALTQALAARGDCPLTFWESPVSEQQLEPATDWRSWQRPLAAKPSAPSVPWPLGWWPSTSASPRAPPPWGWGCWCDSTSKWAKKLFCQHQRRPYYCAS